MKTFTLLALGMIGLTMMSSAWAQHSVEVPPNQLPRYTATPAAPLAPLLRIPHRSHHTVIHEWLADLERAGIFNRSMPTPYRVAIPLMRFGGENGPILKLTYARTLPGSSGVPGPLLFMQIPLE
jgi:hypothetical protein